MASSTGTLVTLGAVAVGGYLLYNYLSTPVAAAAATTTTTPVTPTTGGTSTSTTSTSGTGTGGTSSTTGTGGGGGETQPAAPSLASIYTSILAGVRTDPNFTVSTGGALQANTPEGMIVGTPYRWAVYLNLALPTNIPSPSLSTVFPGVDLTQPMSLSTFWGAMGPALTAQSGLSGFFAGLGAYAASMRGMGDDTVTDEVTGFVYDTGNNIVAYSNPQNPITLLPGSTDSLGPLVQDSMTVTPSTAGKGYNVDPVTGALTPAGMSTTTILMLAAAGIFGFALLMGRK